FTSVSVGTAFEAVAASNDPPPVRNTAPVGKPLTVPLNPKPWRAPPAAADAAAKPEAEYDGPAGAVAWSLQAAPATAPNASIPAAIVLISCLPLADDDGAVPSWRAHSSCPEGVLPTSTDPTDLLLPHILTRRARRDNAWSGRL